MTSSAALTIVVPGDDPPQLQGSSAVDRLRQLGDLTLYTDRPATFEEKISRVKDADVIVNTRSLVTWRREEFAELPKLKLIAVCSIGVERPVPHSTRPSDSRSTVATFSATRAGCVKPKGVSVTPKPRRILLVSRAMAESMMSGAGQPEKVVRK